MIIKYLLLYLVFTFFFSYQQQRCIHYAFRNTGLDVYQNRISVISNNSKVNKRVGDLYVGTCYIYVIYV